MTRSILCVTGSRALARNPLAAEWARTILRDAITALGPNGVVVHGGAIGPDTWADEIATELLVDRVEYRLDGTQYFNGKAHRSWAPTARVPTADREWPLARNDAMVAGCIEVKQRRRDDVTVLALIAPWSRTRGAKYTAQRAEHAGLVVRRMSYEVRP